jgi:ATP-binding cassette subfamily F protein 3
MITLEKLSLHFGARVLLDDVSLQLGAKDKTGLVGSNGSGKTTLLKIIAGENPPDSGQVHLSRHTTVGYLPQEQVNTSDKELYDEVYYSSESLTSIQEELESTEKEIQNYENKESEEYLDLIQNYSELQLRFELLDGFKLKAKTEKILFGLGFREKDFRKPVDEFSEGWQMRAALAKLLLNNPGILLLDEPTNHLDIDSLLWLENYLKTYNGSFIIVSHDRKFLNNLTTKTIEISNGSLEMYSGNYDFYVHEKEERKKLLESRYNNQQKYLREQEKFIERFRYKATKARAVQSRIKMLSKLDLIETEEDEANIGFSFPPAEHSGKVTLTVKNLRKSYDGKTNVLENLSMEVSRGEKIAVLGMNGTGKSTLTRILAGKEKYDSGKIEYGFNVITKYFAQDQSSTLDTDITVLETMEEVSSGETTSRLRTLLGGFLFRGDDVFKNVGVLSGGEKSRLALARMLLEKSNFLILDEPTNHLDMKSKDVLAEALRKYEGTILVVSHDREFLSGIINKIIEVRDGGIKTYLCSIQEYSEMKEKEIFNTEKQTGNQSKDEKEISGVYARGLEIKKRKKEIMKKMTAAKKAIALAEHTLLKLEKEKKEFEEIMSDENFYKRGNESVEIKISYDGVLEKIEKVSAEWSEEIEKFNNLEEQLNLIK